MDKAKEKIPKECRICDTCITSFSTIGGNLYTRQAKNINHVHRDSKDIMSVIIILVTGINGGETVFKSTCTESFTWKVCYWCL